MDHRTELGALAIGILGNGLFGIGLRAVQDREKGILRRLHLAPISAAPVLFATLVSGLLVYLPAAILTVLLAHWVYYMPLPANWGSLLLIGAIVRPALVTSRTWPRAVVCTTVRTASCLSRPALRKAGPCGQWRANRWPRQISGRPALRLCRATCSTWNR